MEKMVPMGFEGSPTVDPADQEALYRAVTDGFLTRQFNVDKQLESKDRLIMVLAVLLTICIVGFGVYASIHNQVRTYFFDMSSAGKAQWRQVMPANLEDNPDLVRSEFFKITPLLFGYTRDSLVANRGMVAPYLSRAAMNIIESDTTAKLLEYGDNGNFAEGNSLIRVEAVEMPRITDGAGNIQVLLEQKMVTQAGHVRTQQRYLVTYQFTKDLNPETVLENPLGISVEGWEFQKVMEGL